MDDRRIDSLEVEDMPVVEDLVHQVVHSVGVRGGGRLLCIRHGRTANYILNLGSRGQKFRAREGELFKPLRPKAIEPRPLRRKDDFSH